jgi:hypothetical protein
MGIVMRKPRIVEKIVFNFFAEYSQAINDLNLGPKLIWNTKCGHKRITDDSGTSQPVKSASEQEQHKTLVLFNNAYRRPNQLSSSL